MGQASTGAPDTPSPQLGPDELYAIFAAHRNYHWSPALSGFASDEVARYELRWRRYGRRAATVVAVAVAAAVVVAVAVRGVAFRGSGHVLRPAIIIVGLALVNIGRAADYMRFRPYRLRRDGDTVAMARWLVRQIGPAALPAEALTLSDFLEAAKVGTWLAERVDRSVAEVLAGLAEDYAGTVGDALADARAVTGRPA
jgi:hypothetical protein